MVYLRGNNAPYGYNLIRHTRHGSTGRFRGPTRNVGTQGACHLDPSRPLLFTVPRCNACSPVNIILRYTPAFGHAQEDMRSWAFVRVEPEIVGPGYAKGELFILSGVKADQKFKAVRRSVATRHFSYYYSRVSSLYDPGGGRTRNLQLRRLTHYPIMPQGHVF